MSQVIECPSCSKKFKLPPQPPAIFTCTGCQTPMDLSDFGGAEAPPPPPAGRRAVRRGGGRSAPRRGGRPSARRGRGRGARGGHDDYDDEDGGYRGRGRREQNNTGLVIGAGVAVIIAVIAVIAITKDDDPAPDEGTNVADNEAGGTGATDTTGMMTTPNPMNPGGVPGTPTPVPSGTNPSGANPDANPGANPAGADPAAGSEDPQAGRLPRRRSGSLRLKNINLKVFDWPDEVPAETRGKVEEAIENLYLGGRDGIDAEAYLVKEGHKICGRIISEFKTVTDEFGLDSREGMSRLMVLDRTLRKIDGYQERRWRRYEPIKHASAESYAMSGMKIWVHWWDSGEWKEEPRKPWDPRIDSKDDEEEEKKDS